MHITHSGTATGGDASDEWRRVDCISVGWPRMYTSFAGRCSARWSLLLLYLAAVHLATGQQLTVDTDLGTAVSSAPFCGVVAGQDGRSILSPGAALCLNQRSPNTTDSEVVYLSWGCAMDSHGYATCLGATFPDRVLDAAAVANEAPSFATTGCFLFPNGTYGCAAYGPPWSSANLSPFTGGDGGEFLTGWIPQPLQLVAANVFIVQMAISVGLDTAGACFLLSNGSVVPVRSRRACQRLTQREPSCS